MTTQDESKDIQDIKAIMQVLPVGIIVLDDTGRISQFNPVAQSFFKKGLNGEYWRDVILSEIHPQEDDGHEISLISGKRVSISTQSLPTNKGQVIVINDLTQTRSLQEKISTMSRLSQMGHMMAQLAHQIRTPLQTALLYGRTLTKTSLEENKRIDISEKLCVQLNQLELHIKDMLLFAKGDLELKDEVSGDEFLDELSNAIDCIKLHTNAQIQLNGDVSNTQLKCNQNVLIGAVSNLISNAMQACEQTPKLSVSVIKNSANDAINITVSDNGEGITSSNLKNILKSFYTTKSEGTGLGLTAVQNIAKAHGGDFKITSTQGKGTKAEISIPTVNQEHNAILRESYTEMGAL